jgi:ARG/rhodanese/phosphatase superfamily protein
MHTRLLAATLEALHFGTPLSVDNLAMIPLIAALPQIEPQTSTLDYCVMDDALASSVVDITEVSEQGVVPELRFVNRGTRPVLILDGEELLGAKQDRVVNLTILVPARCELTIPVSCVEAGRWRARSRSFTSAPRAQYASGRAKRMATVSCSMAMTGDRRSNQAEVWDDIADKSTRLQADSPTAAMEAIYRVHERTVDGFVERIHPVDGQVGAMFAIDDRIVGFDLFDRSSTLCKTLPKLVRSAAIDAIDSAGVQRRSGKVPTRSADLPTQASRFVAVTSKVETAVHPAVGLGEDVRLAAPHLTGAALVVDGQVIHFSAFAL